LCASGTKFVCLVASGSGDVRAEISFPATKPEETLGRAGAVGAIVLARQAAEDSHSRSQPGTF